MKLKNKSIVSVSLLLIALMILISGCGQSNTPTPEKKSEANYPDRPINMIVPYDPGGGSDMLTRMIDKHAKEQFGNNFTFVYKPGAGGAVGASDIAKSKNDGYTIGTVNIPNYLLQSISGSGDFNADSFDYICQTASDPQILITPQGSKYTTIEEFVQAAKDNPGKLTVGVPGALGDGHVATLMFMEKAGIEVSIVPLKGGSDLLGSILGKHIDAGMANIGVVISEKDNFNILGVTFDKEHPFVPGVPTFKEKGYDVQSFVGRIYVAPKGLAPEMLQKLETGFKNIWDNSEYQDSMRNAMFSTDWKTGNEVKEFVTKYHAEAKALIEKYNK
ncbi:MAG: hypothetical protein JM58_13125 [Peptococcaceae bacterium BICA1-8]|nr:MAG: hypothetical protein JM58_13125 [Peptococcaceae bacterium BICA1-8]